MLDPRVGHAGELRALAREYHRDTHVRPPPRTNDDTVPQRAVDPLDGAVVGSPSDAHLEVPIPYSASRVEGCVNAQSRVATPIRVL